MSDQQRYSEEEVQSILRDALRRPSFETDKGFSREDIQRFAAEVGISEQAVEQSLSKHKGRRRAKLIEHSRKTALTLDWELSDKEIDGIAELCEVLPPYAYKLMGNFATIRIDRLGFYCMVSVLRKDGYTQIELDRGLMMEVLVGLALFIVTLTLGGFFASSIIPQTNWEGKPVPVDPAWTALYLLAAGLGVVLCAGWYGSKNSTARRRDLAEDIISELSVSWVK